MWMLELIFRSADVLAQASKGSPLTAAIVVFIYYIFFNLIEVTIEKLIWGERFEHWLDPIFIFSFMMYTAIVVYKCSQINQ